MTKIKKFLTGIFAVVFAVTLGFGSGGAKSAKADDQPPPLFEHEITAEAMESFVRASMGDIFEILNFGGSLKLCIIIDGALMPSFTEGMDVNDCAEEYLISSMVAYLSEEYPNSNANSYNLISFFSSYAIRLFVYSGGGASSYTEITKSTAPVRTNIGNYNDFLSAFNLNASNCVFAAMTSWVIEQNLYQVLSDIQDNLGGTFSSMPTYILPLSNFSSSDGNFYVKVFDWDTYTLSLTTI